MPPNMSTNLDSPLTIISSSLENTYPRGINQAVEAKKGEGTASTELSQELQPYRVTISEDALRKAGLLKDETQSDKTGTKSENNNKNSPTNTQETRELEHLKMRDREVRAHEQAHVIAGGNLVRGAANFGYATGSDGKLYAVSGEVSIDSSPVRDDPEATIRKMIRVTRAALAPAQPSEQDRAVASAALKLQVEAQQQITQEQMEKMQGGGHTAGIDIQA